jgi:hypothetical protein
MATTNQQVTHSYSPQEWQILVDIVTAKQVELLLKPWSPNKIISWASTYDVPLSVLSTPYDQLPLLINDPDDNVKLITSWRLTIGK